MTPKRHTAKTIEWPKNCEDNGMTPTWQDTKVAQHKQKHDDGSLARVKKFYRLYDNTFALWYHSSMFEALEVARRVGTKNCMPFWGQGWPPPFGPARHGIAWPVFHPKHVGNGSNVVAIQRVCPMHVARRRIIDTQFGHTDLIKAHTVVVSTSSCWGGGATSPFTAQSFPWLCQ